jgi:hypothetical protein
MYYFSMPRSAAVTLLTLTAATLALHAQTYRCGTDATSTLATDRPQITNSSIVVPCGSLQFENGFQETSSSGQRGYDLPETSIRLGIARNTELRFATPDYFFSTQNSPAFPTGAGDTLLGLKQHFGPVAGFDLSLIPSLSLPTGAYAISSHGYDPSLLLPWSRSLSKTFTLAGQLGLLDPTVSSRRDLNGQASLYLDRQLTAPCDAYIEYSGTFPQRGGPAHLIDLGTAYKLTPHQQLDLHINLGISANTAPFAIGVGYSFRLQPVSVNRPSKPLNGSRILRSSLQ